MVKVAKLLEDDAKKLLRDAGMKIPRFARISDPAEAAKFFEDINAAIVIKALVPVGGRQKLGGVKFANSPTEAKSVAESIFGRILNRFPVDKLLVEEKVISSRELYLSFTYDNRT